MAPAGTAPMASVAATTTAARVESLRTWSLPRSRAHRTCGDSGGEPDRPARSGRRDRLGAAGHPRGAVGRHRARHGVVVRRQLVRGEGVAPTSVRALVQERVGPADEVTLEV